MQQKDHDSGRTTVLRLAGIAFSALLLIGFVASQVNYSSDDSPFAVGSTTETNSDDDRRSGDVTALPGRAAPETSRGERDERGDDSGTEPGARDSGNAEQKSGDASDDAAAPTSDDESADTDGSSDDTNSDANGQPEPPADDRQAAQAASSGPGRPNFTLPFQCGTEWEMTTYTGHDPDDKKVDFFSNGGSTSGKRVLASAGGTVMKLPSPGGVKIDHGGGWYTLSLHLRDIRVSVGEKVQKGDPIGRVGSVGTGVAHLHYEQLYNPSGGEAYTDSNITLPKFAGQKYRLVPNSDFPVATSRNSCG